MNRNDLEKMFDDKFLLFTPIYEDYININNEVKDFIFETIIPEVLKSIMIKNTEKSSYDEKKYFNIYSDRFKQKAKEKFNINL